MRNIAIIAHVDHGKTTLVDFILRQSGTFRSNQQVVERVMDSNDLERERGITILAKNASVHWGGVKINIVDTPGHSDFGGEVERTLGMVDGVLLLVDAAEGPLPQTKFVLKKALDLHLKPIVVINKIDRKDARPHEVLDEVFELFLTLGANDSQLDFPVVYTIAKQGIAQMELEHPGKDLVPLFETILKYVPPPLADTENPLQMMVTTLDWSDYIGRISMGRIVRGSIKTGETVALIKEGKDIKPARVTKLFVFEGMKQIETESAEAGEIVAVAGFEDAMIGDTIASATEPEALPYTSVDEPTIAMNFMVNTSPFAGTEGKFVTSRNLNERLFKELNTNVAMRVERTDSPDIFRVSGRGELQLAILIETMRREGYEFAVSRPEVLFKRVEGALHEPIESVVIDVAEDFLGVVMEHLGKRRGEMTNMINSRGSIRVEFLVPTRGLIGFRSQFLTDTRGTGTMHQLFHGYMPYKGDIDVHHHGALIAMETGDTTGYALESVQERGVLFVGPGTKVYMGMVIGENARDEDIVVNATKKKHLTNMRASGSDGAVQLTPPLQFSLEQFIEFLVEDELLEVTPQSLRIRKRHLVHTDRKNAKKRSMESNEV
ncbi:MAG TPA: translational GTPase TypA [Candidatus Kapabacteria bacterium]|nr:translational GTPase TypA [Candidatus Kapabacteria bacterium]